MQQQPSSDQDHGNVIRSLARTLHRSKSCNPILVEILLLALCLRGIQQVAPAAAGGINDRLCSKAPLPDFPLTRRMRSRVMRYASVGVGAADPCSYGERIIDGSELDAGFSDGHHAFAR
jgi:hypothetical protein